MIFVKLPHWRGGSGGERGRGGGRGREAGVLHTPVAGSSLARNSTRCGAGKNGKRRLAEGNSSTVHGWGSFAAAASENTPVDRYLCHHELKVCNFD